MAELTGAPVVAPVPVPGSAKAPKPSPPPGNSAAGWALVHTAALSAAVTGLLLIGVLTGRFVLAGLMIPVQVLLVLAWLAALEVASLVWSAVVVGATAVAADLLTATGPAGVRRLTGVIAVALLVAMLQQLVRRDGRTALTASFAATLAAVVLVSGLAVLIALRRSATGQDAAMAALLGTGLALFVARGADALRLRRAVAGARRRSVVGLLAAGAAAVGVGFVVGATRTSLGVSDAIALATAAAVVALAADIGLDIARAGLGPGNERPRAALLPLSVLLPVTVAAPAAYVTGRVLLG
jgi:hypothetical protein